MNECTQPRSTCGQVVCDQWERRTHAPAVCGSQHATGKTLPCGPKRHDGAAHSLGVVRKHARDDPRRARRPRRVKLAPGHLPVTRPRDVRAQQGCFMHATRTRAPTCVAWACKSVVDRHAGALCVRREHDARVSTAAPEVPNGVNECARRSPRAAHSPPSVPTESTLGPTRRCRTFQRIGALGILSGPEG